MALKLLKETDPRFQWLGWRVVVFGVTILLTLSGLAAVIAFKQGLFVSKTRLHFLADHGAGLLPGMQVRFSGFRIGVVDKVELTEQAKVQVDLLVESRYMKWIKADSTAQLLQEGLMGDYYIEMMGGSPAQQPLKAGGKVNFAPAHSLADVAYDLRSRALPILDSFQITMDYINDPKGDVRQSVANVKQLTAELQQTRARMDALLVRLDSTAGTVNARLPRILDRTASSLASVESAVRDASAVASMVRGAVEESVPRLPSIVRNSDDLVRDSRDTLQGVRRSWPLNTMLTPQSLEPPLPESRR
ncbi:phospholipid/cholesterol/gamma-HCH transport system substrate-binding protein [Formivibrio citricus]|uniref:Phospholipid/cholesterol/gamma-HCH transport system substrate-binding protein n=2 Tax=Formivibrio citricus TaxID=83765 RepID=A0A1I4XAS3_9NEIS|nr:phospholipid/cholesterol/gamma-HCH transport system substrate-binding protein [Formivibrio citricus]